MILYIHGFNSMPSEDDLQWFKENFPHEGIHAPFINYVNKDAVDSAIDKMISVINNNPDVIIIAKSLGCIIAEYLLGHGDPGVLINPALNYREVLDKYSKEESLANFRDRDLIFEVDKDFLDHIASYHKYAYEPSNVSVFLSKSDELIDRVAVKNKYQHILLQEGKHSIALNDIKQLKREIIKRINSINYIEE